MREHNPYDLSTPVPEGYKVTNVNTMPTLREEFINWYNQHDREDRSDQTIADFWISKFNLHLTSLAEKLGEEEMRSGGETEFWRGVISGQNLQLRKDKDIILNNLLK